MQNFNSSVRIIDLIQNKGKSYICNNKRIMSLILLHILLIFQFIFLFTFQP